MAARFQNGYQHLFAVGLLSHLTGVGRDRSRYLTDETPVPVVAGRIAGIRSDIFE